MKRILIIIFIAAFAFSFFPAQAAKDEVEGQIIESIEELDTGSLIKLPDDQDPNTQIDSTVYYYAVDGQRYVFSNEKCFFTWYMDYSELQIVNAATMAEIPLGGNITYKPGVKLIKFPSDLKVYAVARGGTLRWVQTDQLARLLYGNDWYINDLEDVSEAFYQNYVIGEDIDQEGDYFPYYERYNTNTIATDLGL
ncbi:hypothetical protein KJ969_02675 [Patescibacteria group bacterium]|nr:hypothetical protein [Patescibacteria group bacterium]MBU1921772.1 hypothetical protein [Patescibacteria group bacterium]